MGHCVSAVIENFLTLRKRNGLWHFTAESVNQPFKFVQQFFIQLNLAKASDLINHSDRMLKIT